MVKMGFQILTGRKEKDCKGDIKSASKIVDGEKFKSWLNIITI